MYGWIKCTKLLSKPSTAFGIDEVYKMDEMCEIYRKID